MGTAFVFDIACTGAHDAFVEFWPWLPTIGFTGAWRRVFSFLGRRSVSRCPLKPRSRGLGQASRLLPPPGRSSRLCP
ncbi:hypothetical protein DGM85_14390 [Xanthomonas phaseoli pv. phaseoli]|nr:hypothetical protein DGM93_14175 [Xanthomonas phaseoli pv. phaseoli]QWN29510.1 hypothetical protein DGM85_14390 [Xanthomonas phaseoli pv. phaseoli]QWN33618.1 hypothetical protein DGM81_13930 [Xanthomonas phaseoli pv. phaseoli]RWU16061.1 hypothetical protein XANMN_13850 [Xanthomonas phaseoli pv. manihotis str. CIO151]